MRKQARPAGMAAEHDIEAERPVAGVEEPLAAGLTSDRALQLPGVEVVRARPRKTASGEQRGARGPGVVLDEDDEDVVRLHPLDRTGAAALAAAALDVAGRLPKIHRQVDETWLTRYRDWVYGAGFGLQLGIGALTIASSASLYLTWVVELVLAAVAPAAVVGAIFGLARALPLVGTARVVDADTLRAAHRRWQARLPVARWATVAVQAVGGLLLVVRAS